ncbi:MASE3 domain-containing protein [Pedobacter rhizosphaerae]|uniref:histidine kinase n=1 Tax=Pedobacter rhizosphaerae TaxID=390241 RepID=A0A1H9PM64_9SPHI|nr:MASE3 domain-containing protein [Pedobacter rhizosphaerae]SER48905.1 PAS domain S-box-containing protein [Pedobacter rhizosphaerae]
MLFHTLVELFSIVVAFAVFIVAWNSRKMQDNAYLHVVGLAYLFIGSLDLLHTLSFKGMQVITSDGFPANQFWIATRCFEAMVFLFGFVCITGKRRIKSELIFLGYLIISLLIALSILDWKVFPVCFIQGQGQTDFKVNMEYLVILILFISLGMLYRHRRRFERKTYDLLAASIFFAILSECCFASYSTNIGPINEVGHYGKLISFFLIYKASVEMAFIRPVDYIFRALRESEQDYRTLAENLPGIILRFDQKLDRIFSNRAGEDHIGLAIEAEIREKLQHQLRMSLENQISQSGDLTLMLNGQERIYAYQLIPESLAGSSRLSILLICQEVTASRKEKQYLNALLDSIPHQVWTAAPGGTLEYVNEVMCEDFGESRASLLEAHWLLHIHPEDFAESQRQWNQGLENGQAFLIQCRLKMSDGIYRWHLCKAQPIYEQEQLSLWIGTNTNIHEQKKGQEQRDEFISIASHELKTPLTSIKAFNQLLLRSRDLGKMQSYLQKVDASTTKLERLINEMLDVSRINAGKLQLNTSSFDLAELTRECIAAWQLSSPSHRLEMTEDMEAIILADRFRIEQVINNLLSNAIKYSPEAQEVIVTCKTAQNSAIVSVKDFGIGIAPQELEKLFDRYYRADNAAERFGGLGLGLFISSEIIKNHEGTFWIESEPGKGSTVSFRLPLEEQLPQQVEALNLEYHDEYLHIWCNQVSGCMEVSWKGYQNVKSVQHGGMQMLAILKRSGLHKVLNDNREVLGNWSEASDWAAKVWFPMMVDAGLEHFAWIFSPSVFAKLAAQKSYEQSDEAANVRFFDDMDAAQEWIDHQ